MKKKLFFLLVANCFNRADELAETAFSSTNLLKPRSEMGVNILEKAPIAEVKSSDKFNKFNFFESITAISKIATSWGIDVSHWTKLLREIIEAHLESLKELDEFQETGKICSPSEALDYRKKVIAKYAEILARIVFSPNQSDEINFFKREFMTSQAKDDLADAQDDIYSQINPFVSLLVEENLLQDFTTYINRNKKIIFTFKYPLLHFFHSLDQERKQDLIKKMKKILRDYEFFSLPVYEENEE